MRRISTSITAAALALGLVLSLNSSPAQAAVGFVLRLQVGGSGLGDLLDLGTLLLRGVHAVEHAVEHVAHVRAVRADEERSTSNVRAGLRIGAERQGAGQRDDETGNHEGGTGGDGFHAGSEAFESVTPSCPAAVSAPCRAGKDV